MPSNLDIGHSTADLYINGIHLSPISYTTNV